MKSAIEVGVDLHPRFREKRRSSRSADSDRAAFWSPLIAEARWIRDNQVRPDSPADCEALLERHLGEELRQRMLEYLESLRRIDYPTSPSDSDAGSNGERRRTRLFGRRAEQRSDERRLRGAFGFRISRIRYGSLKFIIEVEGTDNLATLLGGNLDLFMLLLEQFLPPAFQEAVQMELPASALIYETEPNTEITTTFTKHLSNPAPSGPSLQSTVLGVSGSTRFMIWAIANFSLVLPAAAALFACWLLLTNVHETQATFADTLDSIHQHQVTLLEAYEEQVSQLLEERQQLLSQGYLSIPSSKDSTKVPVNEADASGVENRTAEAAGTSP